MTKQEWIKIAVALAVVVAIAVIGYNNLRLSQPNAEIPISKVGADVQAGSVRRIAGNGAQLEITYRDGTTARSTKANADVGIEESLTALGVSPDRIAAVDISYEDTAGRSDMVATLMQLAVALLIGGILIYFLRRTQMGNNQALSFGKSRARVFSGDKPSVTFADVAGVDEAKQELQEVVEFLREPARFTALGARIPKGVLLVGPPGTGKTLMARAVAGEANVPFFSISGSEFVEMFVGVGASRVRDLFETAKRNSPCIVFVDEIDAVGRHRGVGQGGSNDEREQTLNQILVEMDGFDTDTNVIVVAATNRPDILDPALLRPGRFDRRVTLDRPDMNGRKQMLQVHLKGKPTEENLDVGAVAKQTPGFSGADIENLVNEAAILAARRGKKAIGMRELQVSIEKVIAGPERKSRVISGEEKQIIAFHEAGHALVMWMLPNCDPVFKVSIISRGTALGYTMHLPEDDRYLQRRCKFMDDLSGVLGGRVAEELVFGDVTTGASDDLERASDIARAMVTRYGMSDKLGPRVFGTHDGATFLGNGGIEQRNYSEDIARQIDDEVTQIIAAAHRQAHDVLLAHRAQLDAVAKRLIAVETIDRDGLAELLDQSRPVSVPSRVADDSALRPSALGAGS